MIEGGHYNAHATQSKVVLRCLTVIGSRGHFGHFMLDFVAPFYHWLYTHGRLYDDKLKVFMLDPQIERWRPILNQLFACKIKTNFLPHQVRGVFRDMVLGWEGHNRRVLHMKMEDYIGDPEGYLAHFRQYVLDRLDLKPSATNKFLLIERKIVDEDRGGGRRNISNHDNLRAAMSSFAEMKGYDFNNIILEDMSFKEQVQAFSEARVVVGQHGAGFCHFFWMPPGGLLQELHKDGEQAYRFRTFTDFFRNVRHSHLSCPEASGRAIEVPVEQLVTMMTQELEEEDE